MTLKKKLAVSISKGININLIECCDTIVIYGYPWHLEMLKFTFPSKMVNHKKNNKFFI